MKPLLCALFALTPLLPTTSAYGADYASTAQTLDFGGHRTTSADYSSDGSVTTTVGISSEPTSATTARHGFIGQLYELLGYGLLASDYYPPEAGTTQLFPVRTADMARMSSSPPRGSISCRWKGRSPASWPPAS
jgi:hypothetical protein